MFRNISLSRRPAQVWGNTEFPDEQRNKRVYVKGFNTDTITIDNLLNFFGRESIEGIKLVPPRGYACIQFKKPSDQTGAVAKHNMQLNDRTIIVEPDKSTGSKKRRVTPPSCKNNLQAQRTSREPSGRHPSSSHRSRSRSPRRHRSYDRSPERGNHRHVRRDLAVNDYAAPSHQLQPARFHVPNFNSAPMAGIRPPDAFVGDSVMNNYTAVNAQAVFPPSEPKPTNFFQSHHVVSQSHQQYPAPQPAIPPSPAPANGVGGLPSSINLALQLVISHNSARNLSIEQIQDVIDYFQAEKRFLLQRFTDANTNASQVPQQSQQVAHPVMQQQSDTERQANIDEESPQVSTEQLNVLEGTLRIMRELTRS